MTTLRPLRGLLAALVALALGACSTLPSGGGGTAASHLPAILARGTLRVGLTGDQPPLNMTTKDGEIVGLEPDLMRALANSMGLQVQLVPMAFADLLPALERGDVDLVASGVTITPERNARMAFAGPYFITGTSALTRAATLDALQDRHALDDPKRTYAALAGSTSEAFAKAVMPHAKLVATRDYEEGIRLVTGGQADAMIADFLACQVAMWRNPDAGLATLATPLTAEPIGIALPAGDPLFVNLVQNYLATLKETGILTQLKARWLSNGAWIDELR